ncbi:MAG: DUF1501 domain-containing protein [Flavobacteriales bacterium]
MATVSPRRVVGRRRFLQQSALVSTAWLLPSFLKAMGPGLPGGQRRLVVLQLSGGNDGLNTVVPFRHDVYAANRKSLALPKDRLHLLTDDVGLNPGAAGLRALYDEGLLSIVQGIGYPDTDRSHFRSLDIWHTASASNEYLETGWLGRYLDHDCSAPHEVIEVGPSLTLANKGERLKAITLTDANRLYRSTREPYFAQLAQHGEHQHRTAAYLYKTMAETYQSAAYLKEKLKTSEAFMGYAKDELGKQLRTVANFIKSGFDTRAYYVSLSGFDTHGNQLQRHERLLKSVGDNLLSFVNDLKAAGELDSTVVMVFSEFGRRVKQNASKGTDHGAAGPLFLVGGGLKKPGLFNAMPSLDDLDTNGDLKFSVDFRSVYASVLRDWLGTDPANIIPGAVPVPGLIG